MPLLELQEVNRIFHRRARALPLSGRGQNDVAIQALRDVNMTVEQGQALGVVGESGAGKSTLALLISGLIAPTSGSVHIKGRKLEEISRKELSRTLQLVWQDTGGSLDPLMRVGASIEEPFRIHRLNGGNDTATRVNQLLSEVGLGKNLAARYPHELSGGELQRVIIARALATDPQLLICDELASALDVRIKAQIVDLLMMLRAERGLAYVIIAHDLTLVRKMTEEIIVMYAGTIVEKGPTREVLDNPLHPYSRLLIGSDPVYWSAKNDRYGGILKDLIQIDRIDAGCPFQNGCDMAIERCRLTRPGLQRHVDGRETACLLREKGSDVNPPSV